ncbi:MAG: radical SAM/SPASM domain-containing protein [Dissulfurispiraceae bacterium]|jgi:radical SAM protein with 4Fe4S-binding SPASM domain
MNAENRPMKAKLTPQINNGKRLVLHEHIPLATPLVMYIEPSGYCNFKCVFCPHGMKGLKLKKGIMPVKLLEKLIDDLSAFPDQIKLLRFCGCGEPLLNKDIVRFPQYARERKIAERMELVTTGVLLTTELIENLPRYLDRIVISIEGLSAEDYLRISKVNINYQELIEKLDALYANRGECKIYIKIHNEAVPSESSKAMFFDLFGNRCDEIYIENLVPMWPQFDAAYATGKFRWGKEVVKRKVCAQIFKGVQVQADGEVVPCCIDWNRVNVIGNINNESVYEIWNGEKLRALQIEHLLGNKDNTEPCKDCTMNDYCEIDNIDAYADECIQRLTGNSVNLKP